ncbi:cobyrinate a,c-diamide synthase [Limosilactobacillus sp. STM2_1]|uniref:Cobyrinate a,c-diamide synthase n=1 Tax=Limosilactobacillus rudii TaxID=2759755 RepID=A0A7W3UL16_9LACO|nr:cobyrinate a,c-diamide synthase [Limosilactobacillus rudii]MBB1079415.1 cobyrinate a,c-diamide synthase [Limosilactobacillus rudii]MBB1097461.1 cobyrinate a,c-diamide synthase [Limosilactobacillus rudii]MCD7134570.1 cobyrinate a,c-diamide synthase [Limosilactobacillus rudii]
MKKILIAGVTSGSGKTTVTLGILKALNEQYRIQSYKVGPDYVDTKFHTRITKRPARNLDNYLVPDSATLKYLFTKDTDEIDLGIVEGVMGLYDGLGTDKDAYSTASVAKQLNIPVVLVINARATSTSAAAILKGFIDFDPGVQIKGVIINNVMSQNHYELIAGAIRRYLKLPVLGYLPHDSTVSLPSRQLGLVPDDELPNIDKKIALIAKEVKQHVDLQQFVKIASPVIKTVKDPFSGLQVRLKLGIAKDKAFSFYYADNLNLLEKIGVELVPFSPLVDQKLPDVDALYIGGGYPEEFASQLAANTLMKKAIQKFSQAGKPIYAECGGLMYLGKTLEEKGTSYPMVGIFDGRSQMTPQLKKFGYCVAYPQENCLLGATKQKIIGHEFHHSVFTPLNEQLKPVLKMKKIRDNEVVDTWNGGYQKQKTFASYLHVHFYQSKSLFTRFLKNLGADMQ